MTMKDKEGEVGLAGKVFWTQCRSDLCEKKWGRKQNCAGRASDCGCGSESLPAQ